MKKFTSSIKKIRVSERAFTLVETLVAISILVIALTGPLAILAQSLKSSYFSRDEITAAYLAQEPIEYVRNLRDQNGLREPNSAFWLNGIATDPVSGQSFINNPGSTSIKLNLMRNGGAFELVPCVITCSVKYDSDTGIYGDDNDFLPDSQFTRDVYLNEVQSDTATDGSGNNYPQRELTITVVVSWNTGGEAQNVTVTEHLFNWQLQSED